MWTWLCSLLKKQEVDSHLQVGNFVCDIIHDI